MSVAFSCSTIIITPIKKKEEGNVLSLTGLIFIELTLVPDNLSFFNVHKPSA